MNFSKYLSSASGQTLLEVLVAMGIAVIVVGALTVTIISSLNNANFAKSQNQATAFAQEGMDYMRELRNQYYSELTNYNGGPYCLPNPLPTHPPVPTPALTLNAGSSCGANVNNTFQRQVSFPSTSDATCGKEVEVDVSWTDGKCSASGSQTVYCHKSKLISCFNNPTNGISSP